MDTPVADTAADIRTHDVYLTTNGGRFYINNPNRGVTLKPDQITFIAGYPAGRCYFLMVLAIIMA